MIQVNTPQDNRTLAAMICRDVLISDQCLYSRQGFHGQIVKVFRRGEDYLQLAIARFIAKKMGLSDAESR